MDEFLRLPMSLSRLIMIVVGLVVVLFVIGMFSWPIAVLVVGFSRARAPLHGRGVAGGARLRRRSVPSPAHSRSSGPDRRGVVGRPRSAIPPSAFPLARSSRPAPPSASGCPTSSCSTSAARQVDFHADRAGRKAAVVFQRSAVW